MTHWKMFCILSSQCHSVVSHHAIRMLMVPLAPYYPHQSSISLSSPFPFSPCLCIYLIGLSYSTALLTSFNEAGPPFPFSQAYEEFFSELFFQSCHQHRFEPWMMASLQSAPGGDKNISGWLYSWKQKFSLLFSSPEPEISLNIRKDCT